MQDMTSELEKSKYIYIENRMVSYEEKNNTSYGVCKCLSVLERCIMYMYNVIDIQRVQQIANTATYVSGVLEW